MRNESQHNGDGSFKSILQQRSNPPSEYDRTDVRRAPGSDYATAGCFALAVERNAFTKALPLTLRVLSLSRPHTKQLGLCGKLNQFFELREAEPHYAYPGLNQTFCAIRSGQTVAPSQLREQNQSKRTSPILVEDFRGSRQKNGRLGAAFDPEIKMARTGYRTPERTKVLSNHASILHNRRSMAASRVRISNRPKARPN